MSDILPQQRLLLELLSMSGNIAVPDKDNGTLLFKTLVECKRKGWIILTPFGAGFNKSEITQTGRAKIKDRRSQEHDQVGVERRRPKTY